MLLPLLLLGAMPAWGDDSPSTGPAAPVTKVTSPITADADWKGAVLIDSDVQMSAGTLTIEPGATVTFSEAGKINFGSNCSVVAKATADRPIVFDGQKHGAISGQSCNLTFEHVQFKSIGGVNQGDRAIYVSAGGSGISFDQCSFADCNGMIIQTGGPVEMVGCDFRRPRDLYVGDNSMMIFNGSGTTLKIAGDTFENVLIYGTGLAANTTIQDNVLVNCRIADFQADHTLVAGNYIHNPWLNESFGLLNIKGTIRDNVIRGGTWVISRPAGLIQGNVLETMSAGDIAASKAAGFGDTTTHENISGLMGPCDVQHNILLGQSYAGIITAADMVGSNSVIHNNTFNLRSGTAPLWLNHLPKENSNSIAMRGNLFLNTGRIYDEVGVIDSITYFDYNVWAGTATRSPSSDAKYTSPRFVRVTMSGKNEGDEGFGAHDLPPSRNLSASQCVVNPDFKISFSDDDLLSRKHTEKETLALYRAAYALKSDSPAIGAGDPTDKADPTFRGGKPFAGALP